MASAFVNERIRKALEAAHVSANVMTALQVGWQQHRPYAVHTACTSAGQQGSCSALSVLPAD